MKKILKFLATLIVVTPVAINTAACSNSGSTPTPNPNPPVDINTMMVTIENIFNNCLTSTINNGNLLNEDNFEADQWKTITDYLDATDDNTIINNTILISKFNALINQEVQDAITKIKKDNFLLNFFHGIPDNQILQLDTNNTQWKKEAFDWKTNNFGISNYDEDFLPNIKIWDKISCVKLPINVNFYDNDGKKQTRQLDSTYTFEIANKAANIKKIISLASANIVKKLENYNPQIDLEERRINYQTNQLEYAKLLKENILSVIDDQGVTISNDNIYDSDSNSGIFGRRISSILSYNTYNYLQEDVLNFKKDFTNHAQQCEKDYQTSLEAWSTKNKVTLDNKDSIMFFGEYDINNWSYQGLPLDPFKTNFTITQNDNRQDEIIHIANAFSNLFAARGGLLCNIIEDTKNGNNFNMTLSKTDFNQLVSNSKSTVDDAINMENNQIWNIGLNNDLFTKNDAFTFNTHYFNSALDQNIHQLKFNQYLNKEKDKFNYKPSAYNLYFVCCLDNVFINFSKDSSWNYITNFSITKEAN